MGLFSSKPSPKEVKNFGRGRTSSAKAAEQYARQQEAKQAAQRAQRAIKASRAAARKKGK